MLPVFAWLVPVADALRQRGRRRSVLKEDSMRGRRLPVWLATLGLSLMVGVPLVAGAEPYELTQVDAMARQLFMSPHISLVGGTPARPASEAFAFFVHV